MDWHGPLVTVWHMLYKMAGHRCGKEIANIMDDSEKSRPEVVIYRLTENTLPDVRTVVGGDSRYFRQAGQLRGFGAQWSAHEKNKKWLDRCTCQGDQFIPLVHEAGGTTGSPALDPHNTLAAAGAGSQSPELDAFMTFALQRLRLAAFRGVFSSGAPSPATRGRAFS